jgi:hypothetical protein
MASTGATGLDVITTGAAVAVTSPPGGKGPIAAPWPVSASAGLGNGSNSGAAAVDSEESAGVIFGGNRRVGMTGIRVGKTIRAVSVFGSAMGGWGSD